MRKILLPLASISLMLSGCAEFLASPTTSPAPFQQMVQDEKAVIYGFAAYDAMLTMVDGLQESGKLERNSPKAMEVRGYLVTIKNALNAANAAQKAGSATEYAEAFAQAAEATRLVKLAVDK